MTREDIMNSLLALNGKLKNRGVRGEMFLYGGTVMCLCLNARRATDDVDAIFEPKKTIYECAAEVERENGLPGGWLNDSVKGFVSSKNDMIPFLNLSNLDIYSTKPEYLFAMKCLSCRLDEDGNDVSDIRFLIGYLKIRDVRQAENILTEYFPQGMIRAKTHYMLEEVFDALSEERHISGGGQRQSLCGDEVIDIERLLEKRDRLNVIWGDIPPETLYSFERGFEIEYAHNSTAIEGNTLTLLQTKAVIEDGLSVKGKMLREIYEVANHARTFANVRKRVREGRPLDEAAVKDIHAMLMENITVEGFYRNVEVRITGARHTPPASTDMHVQIKGFFAELSERDNLDAVRLAAWAHAEFVRIRPFTDGNGRTARLIMNYLLMCAGFLPVSIAKEDRLAYFEALEEYAMNRELEPFARMVARLEERRLDEHLGIMPERTPQEVPVDVSKHKAKGPRM